VGLTCNSGFLFAIERPRGRAGGGMSSRRVSGHLSSKFLGHSFENVVYHLQLSDLSKGLVSAFRICTWPPAYTTTINLKHNLPRRGVFLETSEYQAQFPIHEHLFKRADSFAVANSSRLCLYLSAGNRGLGNLQPLCARTSQDV